jgi:O-antigen/teichoic acid export membrane protein
LLMTPLYTNALTIQQYGAMELLNIFADTLVPILSLGFGPALLKFYVHDCEGQQQKRYLVGTILWLLIPTAGIVSLTLWQQSTHIAQLLLGSQEYSLLIRLIALTMPPQLFLIAGYSLLRAKDRSIKYSLLSLFQLVAALGLNVFFLRGLGWGVEGVIVSTLISLLLPSMVILPELAGEGRFRFSGERAKRLLAFGLPLIPTTIALLTIDISDRYFLRYYASLEEVGLYSLGYRLGALVHFLLVAPFQLAWPTFFLSTVDRDEAQVMYSKVLTYFFLVGAFFALAISMLSRDVLRIISPPSFWAAHKIVPVIACSYLFLGVYYWANMGLMVKDKTKLFPLLIGIPAIINMVLNSLLIPVYGMMGAALATLFSLMTAAGLTLRTARIYYPVKLEGQRLLKIALGACVVYALSLSRAQMPTRLSLAVALVLLLIYLLSMFLMRLFTQQELEQMREILYRGKALLHTWRPGSAAHIPDDRGKAW